MTSSTPSPPPDLGGMEGGGTHPTAPQMASLLSVDNHPCNVSPFHVPLSPALGAGAQVDYDWKPLKEHLKAGDFQKADDETRAALIQLAGEEARTQRFVYWTQVLSTSDTILCHLS